MTTPNEQTSSTATETQSDLSTLSFADYEKVRRGETLPVKETQSAPTSKEEGQNKAPESDPEAKEQEQPEGSKEEQDEAETEEGDASAEDKAPKKKGGFQRRIDKLNGKNAELQRRIDHLEQLARNGAGADAKRPVEDATPTAQEGKPKSPSPEAFETHALYEQARDKYFEDLADWKAEQKLKERDAREEKSKAQSDQEKIAKSHVERVKAFAEKHNDWAEAMDALEDVPQSPAVARIILESEQGPALLYELAKDPKEAARICSLPEIAAAREMGKLEARLAKPSDKPTPEKKKITQAPKPIDPVGGGKSPGGTKTPEEMSFAEYEKYRRDQMKRRA